MVRWLRMERWSPYVVGAGIGILSWITFYFMGKPIATSRGFANVMGAVLALVSPSHVERSEFYQRHFGVGDARRPWFDWHTALILALVLGGLVASRLGGTREPEAVPLVWGRRFGFSARRRFVGAFLGGVVLMFGARLGGGSASGHAISGGMQLAVSSWVFLMCMFAGGVAAAFAVYGRTPGKELPHA